MIVYLALAALAGVLAVLPALVSERNRRRAAEARVEALEDRLQSTSLAEYRHVRPVAMPAHLPETVDEWEDDATGTGLFTQPAG